MKKTTFISLVMLAALTLVFAPGCRLDDIWKKKDSKKPAAVAKPAENLAMVQDDANKALAENNKNTVAVRLLDVDGDKDLDIALANAGQPSQIFINDGKGIYKEETESRMPKDASADLKDMLADDITLDGRADLVSVDGKVQVLVNRGNGVYEVSSFASPTAAAGEKIMAHLVDLNGDPNKDLLLEKIGIASSDNSVPIQAYPFLNDKGRLTAMVQTQSAVRPAAVATVTPTVAPVSTAPISGRGLLFGYDLDDDGKPNVLRFDPARNQLSIGQGISAVGVNQFPNFDKMPLLAIPSDEKTGKPKLLLLCVSDRKALADSYELDGTKKGRAPKEMVLMMQNLDKTYTASSQVSGTKASCAAFASFPGHGNAGGIVFVNADGKFDILLDKADAKMVQFGDVGKVNPAPRNIAVGDLDGDGNDECVVANYGGGINIYKSAKADEINSPINIPEGMHHMLDGFADGKSSNPDARISGFVGVEDGLALDPGKSGEMLYPFKAAEGKFFARVVLHLKFYHTYQGRTFNNKLEFSLDQAKWETLSTDKNWDGTEALVLTDKVFHRNAFYLRLTGKNLSSIQVLVVDEIDANLEIKDASFFGLYADTNRVVYVLDRSGSMGTKDQTYNGEKLARWAMVQKEFERSVNAMDLEKKFSVVIFSTHATVWEKAASALIEAGDENKAAAIAFVKGTSAGGWTNAKNALEKAFGLENGDGGEEKSIFFLSDGMPNVGGNAEKVLAFVDSYYNQGGTSAAAKSDAAATATGSTATGAGAATSGTAANATASSGTAANATATAATLTQRIQINTCYVGRPGDNGQSARNFMQELARQNRGEFKDLTLDGAAATTVAATSNTPAGLAISTASLPNAEKGTAYSQTLTAANGKAPYTWSLLSGVLPAGICLEAASGKISGTSTAEAKAYAIKIQVKDADGSLISKDFILTLQ